jgi:hypothetical protein
LSSSNKTIFLQIKDWSLTTISEKSLMPNLLSDIANGKFGHATYVRFASFLSGGFTTMAIIKPPETKLAKCTSVHATIFDSPLCGNNQNRVFHPYLMTFMAYASLVAAV